MNSNLKASPTNKFANEFKELILNRKIKIYQWFFDNKPEPLIVLIISSCQKDFYHIILEDPFDTLNVYKFLHKDNILSEFGIKLIKEL